MKVVFLFFLRLFGCLVAAKLFLAAVGWPGRAWLIALTMILTANLYLFDFLEFRDRWAVRRRGEKLNGPPAKPGGPEQS